jgi:hypothetical protein
MLLSISLLCSLIYMYLFVGLILYYSFCRFWLGWQVSRFTQIGLDNATVRIS